MNPVPSKAATSRGSVSVSVSLVAKNPGGHRRTEMGNSKPIPIPWRREVQDGVRQKPGTLPFSPPALNFLYCHSLAPLQPHHPLQGDHHGFGSWWDLSLILSSFQPSPGSGLGVVYLPRHWLQEPRCGGSLGALRASWRVAREGGPLGLREREGLWGLRGRGEATPLTVTRMIC